MHGIRKRAYRVVPCWGGVQPSCCGCADLAPVPGRTVLLRPYGSVGLYAPAEAVLDLVPPSLRAWAAALHPPPSASPLTASPLTASLPLSPARPQPACPRTPSATSWWATASCGAAGCSRCAASRCAECEAACACACAAGRQGRGR